MLSIVDMMTELTGPRTHSMSGQNHSFQYYYSSPSHASQLVDHIVLTSIIDDRSMTRSIERCMLKIETILLRICVKTTVLTGTEPALRPWTGHPQNICGVQRRFFIYLYQLRRNAGSVSLFHGRPDGKKSNQGRLPLAYHVIC